MLFIIVSFLFSFNLAFTEFLPETVETKFFFRGETVILRSFLPASNTLRRSVMSLAHSSDRQMYPKLSYVASTDTCLDDEGVGKQTDTGMNPEELLSKGERSLKSVPRKLCGWFVSTKIY